MIVAEQQKVVVRPARRDLDDLAGARVVERIHGMKARLRRPLAELHKERIALGLGAIDRGLRRSHDVPLV